MFQRASKIIIKESSASRNAHPAVGNIGYINSMYLFFKDKFILLDAFFFQYKSDKKENKTRCEKKRFLIDLGMKKAFKHRIKTYGVKRRFFIENNYVANLTPHRYNVVRPHLLEYPSVDYVWCRNTDNERGPNHNSLIKIPYGQIALSPSRKKSIMFEGQNALRCWANCLLSIINSGLFNFANYNYKERDRKYDRYIYKQFSYVYSRILDKHSCSMDMYNGRAGKMNSTYSISHQNSTNFINNLQELFALYKIILNGCDLNTLSNNDNIRMFSSSSRLYGLEKTISYEKVPLSISRTLIGLFFRYIMMPGNTEANIFKMKKANLIQWDSDKTIKYLKVLEDIKMSADINSSALNRVFTEGLYKQ
jgi:hypothetical protein